MHDPHSAPDGLSSAGQSGCRRNPILNIWARLNPPSCDVTTRSPCRPSQPSPSAEHQPDSTSTPRRSQHATSPRSSLPEPRSPLEPRLHPERVMIRHTVRGGTDGPAQVTRDNWATSSRWRLRSKRQALPASGARGWVACGLMQKRPKLPAPKTVPFSLLCD